MSKKIIYLLSLLMALSLVFAGCKKASTAPGGEGPTKEDEVKPPTNLGGTGLFTDSGELDKYKGDPIQKSTEVAKYENGNYMRNPVITVVGGSTVVVFYEIRYQTAGAGNDVALTGENAVSIAYVQSKDSGISFSTTGMGEIKYVGGAASSGAADAHGAPIVFNTGDKIIVVASAGIGLSSGVYNGNDKVSKLQYSVATITGNTVGEFGAWKDIVPEDKGTITTAGYTQFGTHSARGTVADDGTLLLPVTLANYQQSPSKFGYVLYTGTVNGDKVTWTQKGNKVDMPNSSGVVKETRIPKGTSESDYVYLAVSSDTVRISQGKGANSISSANIQGSDGSVGTLVVPNWQGAASYDPSNYATNSGTKQAILSHVLGTEQNLAIRLVDENFASQTSGNFALGGAYEANAKSSSMDVLKDGTIVMIAEGGKVTDAATRPFYIYFSRFSQAYIASKTSGK
ncbi:sialidase (neuraminidase) family protein-like protein [Brachyspira pilosicoli B2904]|uniref:Sialidase (Neuraminidase) family protein-like protein n=1 Tax=Brachyspira pilosicoli B2904 TaxID=1133568 RepID=J9UIZ3_BRAPL|nr:sialidase family protein [Brachyspira pilosicoli]AFR71141.1 sialidase (neuraminidase) family protein-like protein [Brachyspira pilosicoli B2904]